MTSKLFSNLARRWQLGQILDPFVNDQIRVELESAGISIIPLSGPQQKFTEVPYAMIGALGSQKMVNEYLKMTRLLDSESIDSLCENLEFVFVRRWSYWSVTGYVPLDTAVKMYRDPIGKRDVRVAGHCGCPPPEEWILPKLVAGQEVVTNYHIDSQEGLNLFVRSVVEDKLVNDRRIEDLSQITP